MVNNNYIARKKSMLTWIWAPVTGSRKLNEWFTVLCWIHPVRTNWGRLRYPLHSSEWMIEFATNFLLSTPVRITLSLRGSTSWKLKNCIKTFPNTHTALWTSLLAFIYNKTEKRTNLSLCRYLKIAGVLWNNHDNFLCFPFDPGKNIWTWHIIQKENLS